MDNLKTFKIWCQKVLPLVYDDSLSYYEVLCKVVDYLNQVIKQIGMLPEELEKLKEEIKEVEKLIADFDTKAIEKLIKEHIATMIFVEISDSGYFIYYIPEQWSDIQFNTTGLDVEIPDTDYGRLVLAY